MKRLIASFVPVFLFIALSCSFAWGQATAQISGRVMDQTGAVLPGVEVTATQTETGLSRSAITDETGSYILANLSLGPYRLEAALPGFRTFVQSGIVLQINSNPQVNPVMEVGQVTEQVEVQANAAQVETRTQGVGQVIENERILELPLNGRNVTDLITLTGAAVQADVSSSRQMQNMPKISLAGGLSTGVGYSLDGADHTDPTGRVPMPLPFPDALQEFRVETGALAVNQGGSYSAGAVNAVTKSGTNDFHGSLFEFVRNDLFNARQYFATTGSTLKRNQFGGTIGGPIRQNRVFFFGGYQGTTMRQDPADILTFVPTEAMKRGDFTTFASTTCQPRQVNLALPFVNNQVDPALFSRAAVNVMNKIPVSPDPCGRITYGSKTVIDEHQAVGRIDFQKTQNHAIFGRYMFTSYDNPPPFTFAQDNYLSASGQGFHNLAQAWAIGSTYLISARTVNSLRLVANRVAVHRLGPENVSSYKMGPTDIGVNSYSYLGNIMSIDVSGGFSFPGGSQATFRTSTFQLSDDLSFIEGSHQMILGTQLTHWRQNSHANVGSPGGASFDGSFTGLGMSDFMLGRLASFNQNPPNPLYSRQWVPVIYAQDTWTATPRLTVNLGVRWQPFLPQVIPNGWMISFDMEKALKGVYSTQFKNAPAGAMYVGDAGFPGKSGIEPNWALFAPRIGLGWNPDGEGRMSIRAGWGIAYDYLRGDAFIGGIRGAPFLPQITVVAPSGGFDNPWSDYPGGNPFPTPPAHPDVAFGFGGEFQGVRPESHMPTSQSWNLTLQRQIATDWLVSASYLGSRLTHLWARRDENPAIYFPGTFDASGSCSASGFRLTGGRAGAACSTTQNTLSRRLLTLVQPQDQGKVGQVSLNDDGGNGYYNGLTLSVQRRATRGVIVNANHTWSHCIQDWNSIEIGGSQGLSPRAGRRDLGNCNSDRRHVFNFTTVAETPQFGNRTMRLLASGWRTSAILKLSTGSYLTAFSGQDRSLTAGVNQRAVQVMEDVFLDRDGLNYLNPAAFSQPTLGTFSTLDIMNIEGPGSWGLDMALVREFQLRESHRIEFRGEAYNVTNSLRRGNPEMRLNRSNFGRITTAGAPRILQFALKYVF